MRTRNSCVREGDAFNFVEMVEVQLRNACDEPLIIFVCAQGTGRYGNRWVCDPEATPAVALLRSGDSRIGQRVLVPTDNGLTSMQYADVQYIARAPNSNYWWIACAERDGGCRDAATRWKDYLNLSPASVDPRQGTRLAIAVSN